MASNLRVLRQNAKVNLAAAVAMSQFVEEEQLGHCVDRMVVRYLKQVKGEDEVHEMEVARMKNQFMRRLNEALANELSTVLF